MRIATKILRFWRAPTEREAEFIGASKNGR
jgi:hypothetical protein